jgi:hypothetical protein
VVSWIGASTGQRSYLEGLVEFISFAVVEKAESNNYDICPLEHREGKEQKGV